MFPAVHARPIAKAVLDLLPEHGTIATPKKCPEIDGMEMWNPGFRGRTSHVVSTLMTTIASPKKTTVEVSVALEPHCYMTPETIEPVTNERRIEVLADQLRGDVCCHSFEASTRGPRPRC